MKNELKSELKRLFKSMDFINTHYLNSPDADTKESEIFFGIYQQLGIAWEFLGLQCEHWEGY